MTVLTTLACTVSATGISRPAYADILDTLQANFQGIYGSDAYIDPDSQDGQLLAVFAKAIDDANGMAVAVYNSFSPATAQGRALSSNVKINGIARAVPTNSQVDLTLTGVAGTIVSSGIVSDVAGNRWLLPATVIIGAGGTVVATATAEGAGAVAAAAGTVTSIQTPTLGWQSVTNASAASPGAPVELDATLRKRQAVSTALPSKTVVDGITGAVLAVAGVTAARTYENDTNTADSNGVPAHSISVVAIGGAAADIANAVMLKKTPGTGTYGSTSVAVTDPAGVAGTIKYYAATPERITVAVSIKALAGYNSTIGAQLQQAIADYINGLGIGNSVFLWRLAQPAQLYGGAGSATYELTSITQAVYPAANAAADAAIAFNQYATCAVADVVLTVS